MYSLLEFIERARLSRQTCRHIPECVQCGFQMLDDLLLQDIRRRQIIQVLQAVVLQPEDIQAGLVAGDQFFIVKST